MKIKNNLLVWLFCTFLMLGLGCTNESDNAIIDSSFNNKKESIQSILKDVAISAENQKKSFTFIIEFNENNEFWLKKMTPIDNDHISKSDPELRPGTYQVDCWGSGGETLLWSGVYYSTEDASVAILQCTDQDGGCAEVCQVQASYFPTNLVF